MLTATRHTGHANDGTNIDVFEGIFVAEELLADAVSQKAERVHWGHTVQWRRHALVQPLEALLGFVSTWGFMAAWLTRK